MYAKKTEFHLLSHYGTALANGLALSGLAMLTSLVVQNA